MFSLPRFTRQLLIFAIIYDLKTGSVFSSQSLTQLMNKKQPEKLLVVFPFLVSVLIIRVLQRRQRGAVTCPHCFVYSLVFFGFIDVLSPGTKASFRIQKYRRRYAVILPARLVMLGETALLVDLPPHSPTARVFPVPISPPPTCSSQALPSQPFSPCTM